jgi:hypothetical protein
VRQLARRGILKAPLLPLAIASRTRGREAAGMPFGADPRFEVDVVV